MKSLLEKQAHFYLTKTLFHTPHFDPVMELSLKSGDQNTNLCIL